ncbi:hypothetical protein Dimus_030178 [Dionaea muscipula]
MPNSSAGYYEALKIKGKESMDLLSTSLWRIPTMYVWLCSLARVPSSWNIPGLVQSGLGRVGIYCSTLIFVKGCALILDVSTLSSNRKLAKELVDKWSRPIFNKSTRFEDMRNVEEKRIPYRRPSMKKQLNKSSGLTTKDDDLDLHEFPSANVSYRDKKCGQSKVQQLTIRPEAKPMDFVIRPQSKIDPDEVRARAKQTVKDQCRLQMNKKLQ